MKKQYKTFFLSFLIILLVVATFQGIWSITLEKDVILKTSANNAKFTMENNLDFHSVYVNTTHIRLTQSYSFSEATDFYLWVSGTNDTQWKINSWFTTANSTAELYLTSPLSTNISVGVYSSDFINASATGVAEYTWTAGNTTLSMVANSDSGRTIVITAFYGSHHIDLKDFYTLALAASGGANFTLDDVTYSTPYSQGLRSYVYQVNFVSSFSEDGVTWTFRYWGDTLSTNPNRTITLIASVSYFAVYDSDIVPNVIEPVFAYGFEVFIRNKYDFDAKLILFDSSPYKNYGLFSSTEYAPERVIGKHGYAGKFDGDDYVYINSSTFMQIDTFFTVGVWVYPLQLNTTQTIISKAGEYYLKLMSSNYFEFGVYDGVSWYTATSTTSAELRTWYNVIGELDGSTLNIYVNNNFEDTTVFVVNFDKTSNTVYIGTDFKGIIDELIGYHKVLDSTERAQLSITPIPIPNKIVFNNTSSAATYGFYDNHIERPWVEDVSLLWVDYYIPAFQRFYSAITINQSGYVDANSYFVWIFNFYRDAEFQVSYRLKIRYTHLANKEITLTWERGLANDLGIIIYDTKKTKNLDLNGTGAYATAWVLSIEAVNYIDEETFVIRVISDTNIELVVDQSTGDYYWEYFFDLVDEDGNLVGLGYYDPIVWVRNKLASSVGGTKLMIPMHTHFFFGLGLLACIVISAVLGYLVVMQLTGGDLSNIPIIGQALAGAADWISNLAKSIADFLRPVGDWIFGALMSGWTTVSGWIDIFFAWAGFGDNAFSNAIAMLAGWGAQFATWFTYIIDQISNMLSVVDNAITWFVKFVEHIVGIITWFFTNAFGFFTPIISFFNAIFTGGTAVAYGISWNFAILADFISPFTVLVAVMVALLVVIYIVVGKRGDSIMGMPSRLMAVIGWLRNMLNTIFWVIRWMQNQFISIYNFIRSHIPTIGGGGGESGEA